VTKPRSNHCELPPVAVTTSATQPPVQDSAQASISLRVEQGLADQRTGQVFQFLIH
jgi:hypothetical protein